MSYLDEKYQIFNRYDLFREKEDQGTKRFSHDEKLQRVAEHVANGDDETIIDVVAEALVINSPQTIINEGLIAGMDEVSRLWSEGTYFLPQVVLASDAMLAGIAFCEEKMGRPMQKKGKVVTHTAEGDIHDIGQIIVNKNEAVEYHAMFGGATSAVFTELLGYDTALMNTAIAMGYERQLRECMVNSDRYRDPQSYILCPDNAWEIGNVVTQNHQSLSGRARAAALKCGELISGDSRLRLTAYERDALAHYMAELDGLPEDEGDFIDQCLAKYAKIKGFRSESYGL